MQIVHICDHQVAGFFDGLSGFAKIHDPVGDLYYDLMMSIVLGWTRTDGRRVMVNDDVRARLIFGSRSCKDNQKPEAQLKLCPNRTRFW